MKWRPGLTTRSVLILLTAVLILQILWVGVFAAGRYHQQKYNSIGVVLEKIAKDSREILLSDPDETVEEAEEQSNFLINYSFFNTNQQPQIGRINKRLSRNVQRMVERRRLFTDLLDIKVSVRHHNQRLFDARFHFPPGPDGRVPRALRNASHLTILVTMKDGRKILAEAQPRRGYFAVGALVTLLIFSIVFLTLVATWVVRRVTKPLTSFADAATALGENINQEPLQKTGVKEIDKTVDAFNTMQHSVRSLLDSRTLMIGAMSHNVRTLLTRLRLRTEFIDDEKQKSKAENDLIEMERILSSSLEFSVSNDYSLNESNSALFDLVPVLTTLGEDLIESGNNMQIKIKSGDSFFVHGDALLLKRVFENLLSNAFKRPQHN